MKKCETCGGLGEISHDEGEVRPVKSDEVCTVCSGRGELPEWEGELEMHDRLVDAVKKAAHPDQLPEDKERDERRAQEAVARAEAREKWDSTQAFRDHAKAISESERHPEEGVFVRRVTVEIVRRESASSALEVGVSDPPYLFKGSPAFVPGGYHSGGVVGLRDGEMPAILSKGEEYIDLYTEAARQIVKQWPDVPFDEARNIGKTTILACNYASVDSDTVGGPDPVSRKDFGHGFTLGAVAALLKPLVSSLEVNITAKGESAGDFGSSRANFVGFSSENDALPAADDDRRFFAVSTEKFLSQPIREVDRAAALSSGKKLNDWIGDSLRKAAADAMSDKEHDTHRWDLTAGYSGQEMDAAIANGEEAFKVFPNELEHFAESFATREECDEYLATIEAAVGNLRYPYVLWNTVRDYYLTDFAESRALIGGPDSARMVQESQKVPEREADSLNVDITVPSLTWPGTTSGRVSAKKPNLSNAPKHSPFVSGAVFEKDPEPSLRRSGSEWARQYKRGEPGGVEDYREEVVDRMEVERAVLTDSISLREPILVNVATTPVDVLFAELLSEVGMTRMQELAELTSQEWSRRNEWLNTDEKIAEAGIERKRLNSVKVVFGPNANLSVIVRDGEAIARDGLSQGELMCPQAKNDDDAYAIGMMFLKGPQDPAEFPLMN